MIAIQRRLVRDLHGLQFGKHHFCELVIGLGQTLGELRRVEEKGIHLDVHGLAHASGAPLLIVRLAHQHSEIRNVRRAFDHLPQAHVDIPPDLFAHRVLPLPPQVANLAQQGLLLLLLLRGRSVLRTVVVRVEMQLRAPCVPLSWINAGRPSDFKVNQLATVVLVRVLPRVGLNLLAVLRLDGAKFLLEPRLQPVTPADFNCIGHGELAGEVDALELLLAEEEGECLLEEVDALDQVEDVELLQHLLPDLVVAAHRLPLRTQVQQPQEGVYALPDEVAKVIVLLDLLLLLLRPIEVPSQVHLEFVGIVGTQQEEKDEDRPEKTPDVGEDIVELLEAASYGEGGRRLVEDEDSIGVDDRRIGVFVCEFGDDPSRFGGVGGRGQDALVSFYAVFLDVEQPLCAEVLREHDVVGVLQVVGEVVLLVGIDEGINEVDCKEVDPVLREVVVDFCLGSARAGVCGAVRALLDRYIQCLRVFRGVFPLYFKQCVLRQAFPVRHREGVEARLNLGEAGPVLPGARLERVLNAGVERLSVAVEDVGEDHVEEAAAVVEVVVPDLHAKHEGAVAEGDVVGEGVVGVGGGGGGVDDELVESGYDLVVEGRDKHDHHRDRQEPAQQGLILRLPLHAQQRPRIEKIRLVKHVLYSLPQSHSNVTIRSNYIIIQVALYFIALQAAVKSSSCGQRPQFEIIKQIGWRIMTSWPA